MAVYRFDGDIDEGHNLQVPSEVPKGRASIVVIPQSPDSFDWERLKQAVHDAAAGPYHKRNKEEIDAYIRAERDSWE
ncbi:MAG: hypothetical protein GC168_09210 [Candidatus Hydrogenedens sp.]|nr:hypothetical protein [Candidatus Hydrogenedens sp.]